MEAKNKNKEIESLWNRLEDVPFDEGEDKELILAEKFHCFKKGTPRFYIWHWFDKHHSKGVAYLLGYYQTNLFSH